MKRVRLDTRLLRVSGLLLLAAGALLALAVLWHNWGDLLGATPAARPPVTDANTLQRGQYLVRAGNCIACHTTRGGKPLAGGRAIETPFGDVFSSNLTPDTETGLGRWSAQDFWHALHHGRSRGGRLLAPAFPYEHTSVITREDSDAMFAWLQAQPPVRQTTPGHTLRWPLGTQPALAVWRTLFFAPQVFTPDPAQSHQYNRGAYLVQGLGHCAACHSPRNALGASAGVADLSGSLMPVVNWYAPNLHSDRETGLASASLTDTVRLLQTGQNTQASVSGPMAEVVQHSLQYLTTEDLQAMAMYLQTNALATTANTSASPKAAGASVAERGRKVYERHCATCHGERGEGAPGIYPPLSGNRAVLLGDPTNLVQTVLFGGYGPATQGHPRPFGMPPFVLELEDRDIAAVLTHLRMALQPEGRKAGEVTPLQVNRIRAENDR
jgi:mono/diheme cytochrome c family protein